MYVWARHIKPMATWFKETLKLDLEHRELKSSEVELPLLFITSFMKIWKMVQTLQTNRTGHISHLRLHYLPTAFTTIPHFY
jgi:hypothetical protein